MVGLQSVGLPGLRAVRDHSTVMIHGHRTGRGLLSRSPDIGISFISCGSFGYLREQIICMRRDWPINSPKPMRWLLKLQDRCNGLYRSSVGLIPLPCRFIFLVGQSGKLIHREIFSATMISSFVQMAESWAIQTVQRTVYYLCARLQKRLEQALPWKEYAQTGTALHRAMSTYSRPIHIPATVPVQPGTR